MFAGVCNSTRMLDVSYLCARADYGRFHQGQYGRNQIDRVWWYGSTQGRKGSVTCWPEPFPFWLFYATETADNVPFVGSDRLNG